MIGFELNKEKMGFNKGCWKIKKRRVIKKDFLISEKNRGLQFVEIEDSWNGSIGKESVCAGFGFDKFDRKEKYSNNKLFRWMEICIYEKKILSKIFF